MRNTFEQTGRLWLRGALNAQTLAAMDDACADQTNARVTLDATLRGILHPVGAALTQLLPDAFPTRIVAFDKTPERNWGVPWHQDRVIRVADKVKHPDTTNWSQKAGAWHCEPPTQVLHDMLFLRLHLDDETPGCGPMQIALGSHHMGKIPADQAANAAASCEIETCLGNRGDVLVLKMLTLHCSCTAKAATSRRVLRVDYANAPLPAPLAWAP